MDWRTGIVQANLPTSFARFPNDGTLTRVTDHDPRLLSEKLERIRAERYTVESRRIARRVWRVLIRRRTPRTQRASIKQRLEECTSFASLDSSTCQEMADAALETSGRRGDVLVRENRRWPFIGLVLDGVVTRTKVAPIAFASSTTFFPASSSALPSSSIAGSQTRRSRSYPKQQPS